MKVANYIWGKLIKYPLQVLFILVIRFYQIFISPLLGANCRYSPTCSQYGKEAILKHGPFKGGYLAIRRILRCNPWGGHGHDPVP
ncbi:membrane protein insertion efficiency factor YidD [Sphingobacterium shayense]|uniref:membrane protein insertion efficiency factor YidD n=1 Tax=Sphingobacterium shayense TaxID=626343 RepID=UPI001552C557|nr:membrane protein insertion efficiency factor YidD [Sphingobacterium shayense]NQD71895.1 membrane protein insertion efficiency factor YidD [Sphingobacterium shayense]